MERKAREKEGSTLLGVTDNSRGLNVFMKDRHNGWNKYHASGDTTDSKED